MNFQMKSYWVCFGSARVYLGLCMCVCVCVSSFQVKSYFRLVRCEQKPLSGDRGAFQKGSARTRSDADAVHMRKAWGIMQMRQTRQMQIDEDACIRN